LVLAADFVILGWIGQNPESPYVEIGMLGTAFLFYFFLLILVPVIGLMEKYLIKKI
jgi:hypothetical protein